MPDDLAIVTVKNAQLADQMLDEITAARDEARSILSELKQWHQEIRLARNREYLEQRLEEMDRERGRRR